MPTLFGDVSRILLFLKAVRYGRHEEMLPEFLLTVKNLLFAPGGPPSAAFFSLPPLEMVLHMLIAFTYLPGFVTIVFRGMPAIPEDP